jgi:hypothetical protein
MGGLGVGWVRMGEDMKIDFARMLLQALISILVVVIGLTASDA